MERGFSPSLFLLSGYFETDRNNVDMLTDFLKPELAEC